MTAEPNAFLVAWHYAMIIGAIVMVAAAIINILIHGIRVSAIKEYHQKYEYLNRNEIRSLKRSFYFLGVATMLMVNRYGMDNFMDIGVWFFVRLFISIAAGTLVAYVAYLVLEYYYPTKLDKKLNKWRYMPRINPKTGNKMRLLSEEEEDVHLNEGMQAEENIFSIDYDVWIDETTKDIKIEKYAGHLQALRCGNCGFFTMKVVREEIAKKPTTTEPGELIKHYQCSYCKSIRATSFNISTKEADDYKKSELASLRNNNKDIAAVKIELHSTIKGKKHFEFQNLEQAKKFLEEYDQGNF